MYQAIVKIRRPRGQMLISIPEGLRKIVYMEDVKYLEIMPGPGKGEILLRKLGGGNGK